MCSYHVQYHDTAWALISSVDMTVQSLFDRPATLGRPHQQGVTLLRRCVLGSLQGTIIAKVRHEIRKLLTGMI